MCDGNFLRISLQKGPPTSVRGTKSILVSVDHFGGDNLGRLLIFALLDCQEEKNPGHFCSNNEKQIPTLAEKASHTQ